jgi:hypothetical protein
VTRSDELRKTLAVTSNRNTRLEILYYTILLYHVLHSIILRCVLRFLVTANVPGSLIIVTLIGDTFLRNVGFHEMYKP